MAIVSPKNEAGETLGQPPLALRLWAATMHVDSRLVDVERLAKLLAVGPCHSQYHRHRAIVRRHLERVVGPSARHPGLRDGRLLAACWAVASAVWAREAAR